jgi:hypothetical protein
MAMKQYQVSTSAVCTVLLCLGGCLEQTDDDGTASIEQFTYGGYLGTALGSPARTDTTKYRTNDYKPSCVTNSTAPDMAYTWTAPSAGSYTFSTLGSSFDTVLEVRQHNTGASLGCNDDSNGTLQSTVGISLSSGQTVMIVVDGYGSGSGWFQLNIGGSTQCNSTYRAQANWLHVSQSGLGYKIMAQPIPALNPATHPYAVRHDFYYRHTGSHAWTRVDQSISLNYWDESYCSTPSAYHHCGGTCRGSCQFGFNSGPASFEFKSVITCQDGSSITGAAKCGDGFWNDGENPPNVTVSNTGSSCILDIAAPVYCGDGACNGSEDSYSCPTDCGSPSTCGDGICAVDESSWTCPSDCGISCPNPPCPIP